jgi:hypothetical protein
MLIVLERIPMIFLLVLSKKLCGNLPDDFSATFYMPFFLEVFHPVSADEGLTETFVRLDLKTGGLSPCYPYSSRRGDSGLSRIQISIKDVFLSFSTREDL